MKKSRLINKKHIATKAQTNIELVFEYSDAKNDNTLQGGHTHISVLSKTYRGITFSTAACSLVTRLLFRFCLEIQSAVSGTTQKWK